MAEIQKSLSTASFLGFVTPYTYLNIALTFYIFMQVLTKMLDYVFQMKYIWAGNLWF